MPVYNFSFPAEAAGLPCTVRDASGSIVHSATLGASLNAAGAIPLQVALPEGDYVGTIGTVSRGGITSRWQSAGILDVVDSIEAGGGGSLDPAADQTITGAWEFTSTADPVPSHYDFTGIDFDTGDPIANTGIRFSVNPDAEDGPVYAIRFDVIDNDTVTGSATLDVIEGDPEESSGATQVTFLIVMPTAAASGLVEDYTPIPASDIIDAFNASVAADRITAVPAPGSDATGLVPYWDGSANQLRHREVTHVEVAEGVITSPITIHPDEKHLTPLTLRPALGSVLGTAVLNIEHYDGTPNDGDGYGVAHIDSDGGGGLANSRILWSQNGQVVIDADAGGTGLSVKSDGVDVLTAGSDYAGLYASATGPTARCLALNTATSQTADMIEGYSGDLNANVFRVTADGEVHADGGVVLKSPNGTAYRLVVANDGTLSTEAV